MSAIAALAVGLVAVAFVVGIVLFAALALVGLKLINAAHDGCSWFMNNFPRRHRA